jgi:hypothetical protein
MRNNYISPRFIVIVASALLVVLGFIYMEKEPSEPVFLLNE